MDASCPACGTSLRPARLNDVEIDRCLACGGLWFDARELAQAARCALPPITAAAPSTRGCPRCRTPMEVTRMGPADVERCRRCDGTFLDGGELRRLRKGRVPRRTVFQTLDPEDTFDSPTLQVLGALVLGTRHLR